MVGNESLSVVQAEYGVPDELMAHVRSGVLQVLSLYPAERTVTFDHPKLRHTDRSGRLNSCVVVLIHPNFNAEFCHYYDKVPGDLPNFMVTEPTEGDRDEESDAEELDDLLGWLSDLAD